MDYIVLTVMLTGLASCGHGTPVALNITTITRQQLLDSTTYLAVKNMQCEKSLKQLQERDTKQSSALRQCERIKNSLLDRQVNHNQEMNASDTARQQCQRNLVNLKGIKTELDQCRAMPAKFPSTCTDWNNAGFSNDGKYIIDPDGPGGVDSFEVECLMKSHYGVPMIVMHHKIESKTKLGPGLSFKSYSTKRNVVYQASIEQITAAIKISAKCEQFIKLDCYGTPITGYCTWYSRDGVPMYYWGGAAPGSGKCACGMTNTCDKPNRKCNCDANDKTWRSDSGLLTDRNALPVTKMAFGDLDDSYEYIFYTLGPLRCYD